MPAVRRDRSPAERARAAARLVVACAPAIAEQRRLGRLARAPGAMTPKVLVVSADRIGSVMSGPAIRAYELAKALRPHAEVTLAGVETDADAGRATSTSSSTTCATSAALRPLIADADVIVAQPPWPTCAARGCAPRARGSCSTSTTPSRSRCSSSSPTGRAGCGASLDTLTVDRMVAALHDGHHFLCASEKQRDLWLGMLLGERLIPPDVYDRDPGAALGPRRRPVRRVLRRRRRAGGDGPRARFGIAAEDELVLWNGGHLELARRPDRGPRRGRAGASGARACGSCSWARRRRPPGAGRRTRRARVAAELGVLDALVFFNDGWVPYERARELAARGGLRDLDPPRAPRDALRVPHAAARLLLGRACRWSARRATTCPRWSSARTSAPQCPRATQPRSRRALERVLTAGRARLRAAARARCGVVRLVAVAEPLVRFVGAGAQRRANAVAAAARHPVARGARRGLPDGTRDAQRRRPQGLADALMVESAAGPGA